MLDDHFSDWLPVTSGDPQGSILGPLLFIIYINDLPPVLASSFPYLFADDTKCCMHIIKPPDSILLQLDLNHLFNWSYESNLSFNVSKFGLLRFLNRSSSPIHNSCCMNGIEIKLMNHFKDLGIIFSNDLFWTHHYKQIITKDYQKLGIICRTFSALIPTHTKQLLYLSLIRSQLTYCSQIWRPCLIKDIISLEQVQHRATKYILNDYSTDYKTRLASLHILPLMYSFELADILFLIRCLQHPDPSFPVTNYIQFVSSSTRSSSSCKLVHQSSQLNSSHYSFFKRAIRLWNILPPINLNKSLSRIKSNITIKFWSNFKANFDPEVPYTYHIICPCNKCSKSHIPIVFHLS